MTSIERAADFKACYDEKWIIENVRKACDLAVKYGNTHIRAFADVDSKARLEGVKGVIRGRENIGTAWIFRSLHFRRMVLPESREQKN